MRLATRLLIDVVVAPFFLAGIVCVGIGCCFLFIGGALLEGNEDS